MSASATHQSEYPPTNFGVSPIKFGMWIFLISEIMFFTAMLGSYFVLRIAQPQMFHDSAQHLNWVLAAVNTVILIGSSFTIAMAVKHAGSGEQKQAALMLLVSMFAGVAFLVLKGFEYHAEISHDVFPKTNLFFASYYTLTGCHALHIIGGLIPMLNLYIRASRGKLTGEAAELLGLYWHFVDLVWIFLFPLLYLL